MGLFNGFLTEPYPPSDWLLRNPSLSDPRAGKGSQTAWKALNFDAHMIVEKSALDNEKVFHWESIQK